MVSTPVPVPKINEISGEAVSLDPVSNEDQIMGNREAKVVLIEYGDFQCPYCGKFFKETEQVFRQTYVKEGRLQFVYRDYAFLGKESIKTAEAARCAGDQNKFWEYHDYLFEHQNGENQGNFSDFNLKSFAEILGLNINSFNQCLDSGKYTRMIADSLASGNKAGVKGTPKGFILKDGRITDTIDGAEPTAMVIDKIEKALK